MVLSDAARVYLDTHAVGHLATASADGTPHVIPLCYARIGDVLYFVADDKPKRRGPRALKRLANIEENPRVALVVDDYDPDWRRLAYLLIHLDAALVEDDAEYASGLSALRQRYTQYRSMALQRRSHPMVRMTPRRWHLWKSAP
jgi:PPOX class probable F420-dependent enzyme